MYISKLIYDETGMHHVVPVDEVEYHSFGVYYSSRDPSTIKSHCQCGAILKGMLPDGEAFFHNSFSEGAIDAVNQILTP